MVEVIGTLDGFSTIHPDQFDLALRTLDRDPAGHEQMVGRRLGKFNSPSTVPSHILPIGRYLNRQSVCASTSSCWVAVDSRISPHSGGWSNM